ncbi:MAG: type II toxin-antitoxin system HicA family toxin [Candidatus Woesearchaeota archaeon]|nr:type II toxin-antitoxin system HicA family toxin [Candidatus Woesearchaeota archaeon]
MKHISGKEVVKKLVRLGYGKVRQRGSHVRLEKFDGKQTRKITVPIHRELHPKTLGSILKAAGISKKEFLEK